METAKVESLSFLRASGSLSTWLSLFPGPGPEPPSPPLTGKLDGTGHRYFKLDTLYTIYQHPKQYQIDQKSMNIGNCYEQDIINEGNQNQENLLIQFHHLTFT